MGRTNSDSGISMRDTSPEAVEKLPKLSPVVRHDSALEQDGEQDQEQDDQGDDSSDSSGDSSDEDEMGPAIDVSQYQVASHDEDRHLREELHDRQDEAASHILQSPQPRRYHSFARPRYDVRPGVQHMPYQDLHHPPAYQPRRSSMTGSQMFTPSALYSQQSRQGPFPHAYIEDDPSRETKIGYELLAQKLAENTKVASETVDDESFAPLYRRFDFLNHRVLLHLQDEIAELEEDLRRVDEMIARQQGQVQQTKEENMTDSNVSQTVPTSRRDEVRSGDELCERRSHILGRIYTRLEQYNKALASYRTATTGFAPADSQEIECYQSWMDANKPVDEAESKFLGFKEDLIAIRPQNPPPVVLPANTAWPLDSSMTRQKTALLAALTCVPMALFALAPDAYSKTAVVLSTVAVSGLLSAYIPRALSFGMTNGA